MSDLLISVAMLYEAILLYSITQLKTPFGGHLDLNCLKFKCEVNHDILLLILSPGCWRCIVLAIYDRDRCHTIARYTGIFSPYLKVNLELTLVLLNP